MKTSNLGTFLHAEWEVVHTITSSTYDHSDFQQQEPAEINKYYNNLGTEHWWYNEKTLRHLEVQLSTCTICLH
jgi:hypothetical protein